MNPIFRNLLIIALLVALAVGASQGAMGHGHAPGGPTAGPMSGPMSGMGQGMMGMPTTTVDELTFLRHMIPHHLEAIESAEALLVLTERLELRELLEAIIAAQAAEVDLMRGWLDAWYPDATDELPYEPMMRPFGAAPVADVERAWLEDMIMHHMMAVHEARQLLALDLAEHPEVADLAIAIVDGQMTEIHLMAGWLTDWFGVADPMGGMPGSGSVGGMASMHEMMGMHGAAHGMHGAAMGVPASTVAALARAFLAGRGLEVSDVVVNGTSITYEVTYRSGDVEGVLLIDAVTGEVVEATER